MDSPELLRPAPAAPVDDGANASGPDVASLLLTEPGAASALMRYAYREFGIGAPDAEDLIQETAVRLIKQKGSIHRPKGLTFTIFKSKCQDFSRGAAREKRALATVPALDHAALAPEEAELKMAVEQALEKLTPGCRLLLTRYYLDGLSLREAADETAHAYSGIWKLINRCLRRLKAWLDG